MLVSTQEHEALASLKVAALVAQADGALSEDEQDSIEQSFESAALPPGITIGAILAPAESLETLLDEIESANMKARTFVTSYVIAHMGPGIHPRQQEMLEAIRKRLGAEEKPPIAERLKENAETFAAEARETILPDQIEPVADPRAREDQVDHVVMKYGILTAAIGALPVPFVDMIMNAGVVVLQTKMIHDIGQLHGVKSSDEEVRDAFAGLGLGAGVRVALISLIKIVPIWGSIVGATTAFATTYALGRVADRYFQAGGKLNAQELKALYLEEQERAREIYKRNKRKFDQKLAEQKESLRKVVEKFRGA
ncbi:MAG: hypothetical protein KIS92_21730 [Planctomycetota bacterium]|nr:hypothetical protein [Planctomycetota bacterium]